MKRELIIPLCVALIMAGLVAYAWLHGADLTILNPQGPVGIEEKSVIMITVLLSAIVVVPLFAMLFAFAWKYRASNPKTPLYHDPNWDHDSGFAEFVWWVVPFIIIFFLSIILIKTSNDLDPYKPLQSNVAPMTIEVVALDWKWLFIYPGEGIATVNTVEFPKNTPVRFLITADAPMNQFWIPSLGGQIMAMPGMQTQLNLMASNIGTFEGLSSEISGSGFAGMTFTAHAVSESEFTAWVQSVQNMQHPLNAPTYAALAAPSKYVPPLYYSSVDPDLYNGIIMRYMMAPKMQGMTMPMTSH